MVDMLYSEDAKTIKLLPLQYRVFRIIARAAAEFNDDLASFTILKTENWHENRMPPILYKSVFRLWHHKEQI